MSANPSIKTANLHIACIAIVIILSAHTASGLLKESEIADAFTPNEIRALEKLNPTVLPYLYKDYMKDDYYLLRFLRAQHLNVGNTKDMIMKAHKWRVENKIDTILEEEGELLEVAKQLPFEHGTYGYQHRPVAAIRVGEWKLRKLILSGKGPSISRCISRYLEFAFQATRNASNEFGRNITDAHMVADAQGYSVREHACLRCIPFFYELFITFENYYPRLFKTATAINTPRIFQSLLELLRPALSEHTRGIISIYGHDKSEWMGALLKLMPEDQIPQYIVRNSKNTH